MVLGGCVGGNLISAVSGVAKASRLSLLTEAVQVVAILFRPRSHKIAYNLLRKHPVLSHPHEYQKRV